MKLLILAAVAAASFQVPPPATVQSPTTPGKGKAKVADLTTFSDPYLGLEFTHPPTWTVRRKAKDVTRYTISIPGSAETADLEIRRSTFHSTKDIWQTIQIRANETLHRQIVRQWEQSVINVPMLCTQLSYQEKDVPVTTLTGLYYTKTPLKMLVRLTAPTAEFDKVKHEFDQTLESLHTSNATTPQEDDPDFKFDDTLRPQLAPPKPDVIGSDAPPPVKPLKGTTAVPLVVSTKPVTLRIPHEWTADGVKGGDLTLHNAKLSGQITVSVHYALDSERAALALIHASAPELPEFLPGVRREDTEPTPNLVGCSISTVWRIGKTANGDLITFHASAEEGDFYFIAAFRSTVGKALKSDQKLIRALMDEIGIEQSSP